MPDAHKVRPPVLTRATPVLVFGGPYSNLQATEALLAEAGRRGMHQHVIAAPDRAHPVDPHVCGQAFQHDGRRGLFADGRPLPPLNRQRTEQHDVRFGTGRLRCE